MEAGSIEMQPGLGRGENSMFNVECEDLVGEPYGIAHEDTENVKQEYYEGLTEHCLGMGELGHKKQFWGKIYTSSKNSF